ncbi:hypothetical protein I316_05255 [Kwoniella heveanensis BCC8398]|uniref:ditrans,polycis-polyprenyl diphosphate synthase [(2E,6E)-farnesyldiphosphate specific] n=1 Tax=Kwoniella heveanensis BCC8398 TaxID=1296120 RepID=A0A1B9GQ65_9TREE|nr:hypothetical protein I316_05255 [Kwoniella heveanensis BCC8398]
MSRRLLPVGLAILAYPFFILFHLVFIVSSIILRTYQALTAPALHLLDSEETTKEGRTINDAVNTQRLPPKHIGLILVPTPPNTQARSNTSEARRRLRWRNEVEALKLSVLRCVEWAQERGGVQEISVWDGQGLAQSALPGLIHTLTSSSAGGLPPSPPDSSPSTPTLRPATDLDQDEHSDRDESETPLSNCPHPRIQVADIIGTFAPLTAASASNPLTIHFLPPSGSSALLADLAIQYASSALPLDEITVQKVDTDIRDRLRFSDNPYSDPDIVLIHQLKRQGFWTRLLPRKAPELWGYPFWNLRITEVYQYPTPIPFPSPLRTLIQTLRSSSLPSLRRVGYSISLPPSLQQRDIDDHKTGTSTMMTEKATVLDRAEWEGALDAWGKVEQRLGR